MPKPDFQPSLLKRLRQIFVRNLLPVTIVTLICILALEAGIRIAYRTRNSRVEYVMLPYMVRNFGAVPPWADGLRILDPDDELLYRGRPHAQRTYLDLFCPMRSEEERKALLGRFGPSIPDQFKNNPVWSVSLNADGFRDNEFPAARTANTIRIIALGDSWTFGHNAQFDQTYPSRLRALLKLDFPEKHIEVFNLGMLAYTSHEGLKLLRQKALGLQPDIVLIGYSMNDASISGWHDKDVLVPKSKRFSLKHFIAENSELYKLAVYLGQLRKFESVTMGDTIKAVSDPNDKFLYESWVSADALEAKDYERLESRVRVTPADYDRNIREMIRLVRERGAVPILLHNELRPGSPYQAALQKISREANVPLVDSCEVIGKERQRIEAEMEQKLGLQTLSPSTNRDAGDVQVIFRVLMDHASVPKTMSIVGPYPQLGDNAPNKVEMFDDGTHGDQKAGDNVWSFAATFSPGQKIFYMYTNSGEEGKWENLDLPKVRNFVVPSSGSKIYRPIETFGKLYLQADGFHTNAQGYELMAQAIRDLIVQTDRFQSLVHR
ncbi:MAG TPA: SGNH/GDSL hydrolase family protein [Pyrinomonadaceae bacterium]